jgi:hypothetical protein
MVMRSLNIATEMAGQKRRNVVMSATDGSRDREPRLIGRLMVRCIRSASARAVRHAIAAALLLAVSASAVLAQTLAEPAPSKWSPASKAAKSKKAAQAKACGAFGPGFVNVPGTDACVKIGGWVTVEGSARR